MRLTIDSGEPATTGAYAVHFHYVSAIDQEIANAAPDLHMDKLLTLPGIHMFITRETYCTVHHGPCKLNTRPCETSNSHTGIAKCNPKDMFVRWKGRKLAFTRAISCYSPKLRTLLWAAYLAKCPPPPTKPPKVKPEGASNVVVMSKMGAVPGSQASAA
jgi:hypothetical protein